MAASCGTTGTIRSLCPFGVSCSSSESVRRTFDEPLLQVDIADLKGSDLTAAKASVDTEREGDLEPAPGRVDELLDLLERRRVGHPRRA
jgi:hypothetical protein